MRLIGGFEGSVTNCVQVRVCVYLCVHARVCLCMYMCVCVCMWLYEIVRSLGMN